VLQQSGGGGAGPPLRGPKRRGRGGEGAEAAPGGGGPTKGLKQGRGTKGVLSIHAGPVSLIAPHGGVHIM
jgi:hypothetical protein